MAAAERKAVEKLVSAISQPGFSMVVFADAISDQHPTHQQTIMRAFSAAVDVWYGMYQLGHYDLRNEGTVFTAARMRESLDHHPIPLPYV